MGDPSRGGYQQQQWNQNRPFSAPYQGPEYTGQQQYSGGQQQYGPGQLGTGQVQTAGGVTHQIGGPSSGPLTQSARTSGHQMGGQSRGQQAPPQSNYGGPPQQGYQYQGGSYQQQAGVSFPSADQTVVPGPYPPQGGVVASQAGYPGGQSGYPAAGAYARPAAYPTPQSYPQSGGQYPVGQRGYSSENQSKSPSQNQWTGQESIAAADKISRFPTTALARTTVGRVPGNNTVKAKAQIPLGIVLQPLATGVDIPVVNFGQSCKVIRCAKCRIYMNPFVKWLANGNRWQCNFCDMENDTPNAYYCPLNASGEREDNVERQELSNSAVDFVASPDYMSRPPMEPKYLIVMDVSMGAVQSGLVATASQTLKTVISSDRLGCSERANFGLITFDSNVHFYTIQPNQTRVQISVVAGTGDPYIPSIPISFLLAGESKNELIDLLDGLPTYWRNQEVREANILAALSAARSLLRTQGGKIILIMSTLPMNPELGLNPQHELRDAKGRPATSRIPDEIDGLRPSSTYFTTLTNTMAHSQISIDLLAAPPSFHSLDLASLSELAKGSGGQFYYYPAFRPQMWGEKFTAELDRLLTAKCGWEAVMRVRVSKGWTVRNHYGNFCFRGIDLMMLPCFTEDTTVVVSFDNVDSVVADPICYLQSAVLYSTSDGERRIRVTNTALPTTLRLPDLAMSVDIQTTARFLAVRAMEEGLKSKLGDARVLVHSTTASIASLVGIVHPATPPSVDPFAPLDSSNALQMVCLICAGMLKCPAFREGKDIPADLRVYFWNRIRAFPISVILMFTPVLYEISQLSAQAGTIPDHASGVVIMPPALRLTARVISGNGAYLGCDGESIYIWVGRGVQQTWISQAFGVQSFDQIVPEYSEVAFGSTSGPVGSRLANIVKHLRSAHPYNYLKVHVCKQGDPTEFRFTQLLVEDKSHAVGVSLAEIWQKYAVLRSPVGTVAQPAQTATGFGASSIYR